MHARHRSIAALLVALAVAALVMIGSGPASAAPVPHVGESACTKPAPRNDDTIHVQGCLTDTREKPPKAVPGVKFTVVDDQGKNVGEGTSNDSGVFDIALPGKSIDVLGNTYTVKLDKAVPAQGRRAAQPQAADAEGHPKLELRRLRHLPDRRRQRRRCRLAPQAPAARGRRPGVLAAARDGRARPVDDLRHDGPDELRARRADHVRSAGRLRRRRAARHDHIAGTNVTIAVSIVVAAIASGGLRLAQRPGPVATAAAPRHRPGRDDGREHRPVDLPAQPLPVHRRRRAPTSTPSSPARGRSTSARSWSRPRTSSSSSSRRSCWSLSCIALQRTKLGKATRAVADNTALASATGINVDRVISVVWIVRRRCSPASPGVLLGMTQGFDYQLGFKILLLVFAATVLGGLGTAWGAIVGALVIGLFVEVSTLFIPAELKFVGALVVLIVVLLIRPQGLLGKAQRVG